MIGLIARRELLEWSRDGRVRWLAGSCVLVLLTVLMMAWQSTRAQIDLRQAVSERELDNFLGQGDKNPHAAAHFGQYAFRPTLIPAAIDPGVSAWMGSMIWMEAHRRNLPEFRAAEDGAGRDQASAVSVAWVLQSVVPLLLLIAGFASIAGERERGTLPQLLAQGVPMRMIVIGKGLAILVAISLVLVPLLIAVTALQGLTPQTASQHEAGIRLASLGGVYLLYFLGFAGLVLCVSLMARTARTALMILLVLWVGLVVLVPRFAADAAAARHPLPAATEFWAAIKRGEGADVVSEIPAERAARLRATLTAELLARYGVERLEDLPVNFTAVYLQSLEEADAPIFDHAYGGLWNAQEQQRAVRSSFGVFSPTVSLREVSMALAGSDPFALWHFSQSAESHRRILVAELNGIQARDGAGRSFFVAPAETWAGITRFNYEPPSLLEVVQRHTRDVWLLFLWAVIPLSLAFYLAGKVRPTR